MDVQDIMPGMLIRITSGHTYAGRSGCVVEVGVFESITGVKRRGAKIDIGEAGLLIVSPEQLEHVDIDRPKEGWEEFDI